MAPAVQVQTYRSKLLLLQSRNAVMVRVFSELHVARFVATEVTTAHSR